MVQAVNKRENDNGAAANIKMNAEKAPQGNPSSVAFVCNDVLYV